MRKIMFKNMAEFKREAKVGRYIKGAYYEKPQSTEWRKIAKVRSNGVSLETKTTNTGYSFFDFPKASTVKIADGVMEIYQERVKFGNTDAPADTSCLKWDLERGLLKESDLTRYTVKIAQYELGEE